MTRDLKSNLAVVQLLKPQAINDTDTLSALLDCLGYESASVIVSMGVFTGADSDSTMLPVLLECDTTVGASFTAVAAADIIGAFTLVNSTSVDELSQIVGYRGSKRYVRVNFDFTTGTGGITSASAAVLGLIGRSGTRPVTAPAAVAAT